MKTSQQGINLIKSFEGLRLTAYKAVSSEKYYTIGYGHYGSDVFAGMQITQSVAEELLKKDLVKFENAVNKYVDTYKLNQNMFDALVSFTYNCGTGNLDKLTNNGKRYISDIRIHILEYNKSGGKVLNGLVKRREAELKLFDTPCNNEDAVETTSTDIKQYKEVDGFTSCDFIIRASSLRIRDGIGINNKQVGSIKNNNITHVIKCYWDGSDIWGKIEDNKYICIIKDKNQYAVPYLQRNIVEYSLKRDGDKYLSDNFKVKEFKCKDGSDKILIDHYLVYFLQLIRNNFKKAVNINSGYRTSTYNKKVGGASKSQHLQGAAADIHINGVTPLQIAQYAETINMQGIGLYNSFTHVDTRSTKSFWKGSNQIKMVTFK